MKNQYFKLLRAYVLLLVYIFPMTLGEIGHAHGADLTPNELSANHIISVFDDVGAHELGVGELIHFCQICRMAFSGCPEIGLFGAKHSESKAVYPSIELCFTTISAHQIQQRGPPA